MFAVKLVIEFSFCYYAILLNQKCLCLIKASN